MIRILVSILFVGMVACNGTMPITANPDDHTNAGGTAGSARMTNQLPTKNNNVPPRVDTIKLPNDTIRVRQ